MIADRNGNIILKDDAGKAQKFFYKTFCGRVILKLITRPFVSKLMGKYKNSKLSKRAIYKFIKKNNIDMSQFIEKDFVSYNDFFTRKIKEGKRTVDYKPSHLISPCDSKLSVYSATKDGKFKIKNSLYSLSDIAGEYAEKFYGGTLLVFRLTVDDYHRYSFFDNGIAEDSRHIKGVFHTVNPIAMDRYKVFHLNTREYTLIHTENFGDAVYCEVGALMVGKIVNNKKKEFVRGEEKGYFEFGGSTVCVLLSDGAVKIDDDIMRNNELGYETKVKLGEKIGEKLFN